MRKKNIMMLLGGEWHKFDEFEKFINKILGSRYNIESTYDFKTLRNLENKKIDLLIFYTCIDKKFNNKQDNQNKITDDEIIPLVNWVKSGGRLLTFHSTTVLSGLDEKLKKLLGGNFISHPEPFHITIYPVFKNHPVIKEIPAFTILDEFYIQQTNDDIEILMLSIYMDYAYPMVWVRHENKGKILNISMGHDENVWNDYNYQKLILQSVFWLTKE